VYFDHVPHVAWEFYISGYRQAQKWLKDFKGRILPFEDIQHYQRIIVALAETEYANYSYLIAFTGYGSIE
jgi:Type ISP C-terminal specificity domain